ncbi:MAG: hypothetical protein ABW321_04705 [Polyangiales bacterium]
MPRACFLYLCLSCAAWSLPPMAAAAQGGAMGQGEASIAVRSDVKLSVKGTGGTPSDRLSKLGQAVSDQMVDIRTCYRELVEKSPEMVGSVRVRLGLADGKRPEVEMLERSTASDAMIQCVTKVLVKAKYVDVGRPAAAFLSFEFDNSRARGEVQMKERAAEIAQVKVNTTVMGASEATWSTTGDEVRFIVKSDATDAPRAVALILEGIKRGYAAFLDCRRKCEQGGASPEGDINAKVAVDAKGKPKVSFGAITVAHKRAPGCTERAFARIPFDKPAAPVEANVKVHFAP